MSKDKIFHRDNTVYYISASYLPIVGNYYFDDDFLPTQYQSALEAALSQKAVEVTNAITNQSGSIWVGTHCIIRNIQEGTLYDLPESLEVKINPQKCQCRNEGKDESYRISHCDYSCDSKTTAKIVPKQPESVKEDQDQLFAEFTAEISRRFKYESYEQDVVERAMEELKSKFTLTRKQ